LTRAAAMLARMSAAAEASSSVDEAEIARFAALAARWWDADGPMRPLHRLNPTRLVWIKGEICQRFGRDPKDAGALSGLTVLDVGCGAGILAEPLARMGAAVTGIDPSPELIAAARLHAGSMDLSADYKAATADEIASAGARFDVVMALEVVEHVPDVERFIADCASMVKPGGMMIAATINRTFKAFLLAIVGAEYVLRWLPRGTHSYERLVTPDELSSALHAAGLKVAGDTGIMYVPFVDEFRLTRDLDVNYMMAAVRD
jgi:2-polyprenyl-6-hydroxyphenyl methylase/3-demethylubiquinone-9 3-methyltransferase